VHKRHDQQDSSQVIAKLHPFGPVPGCGGWFTAINSPVQKVAAKLGSANSQSGRTIDAIGPEVAPEPKTSATPRVIN